MKNLFFLLMIFCMVKVYGQDMSVNVNPEATPIVNLATLNTDEPIKIINQNKWKIDRNKIVTGGLLFVAGAAKGFNETLWFHYGYFQRKFPKANGQWFNPRVSNLNKYKNADPQGGAKFPLSTSVLVMFTDQYHLNNFFNRASIATAVVIKIGQKKKPLKHYLFDMIYYTATYQAGWCLTYLPFVPND